MTVGLSSAGCQPAPALLGKQSTQASSLRYIMTVTSETDATATLIDEPLFGNFVSGVVLTFGTRLLMVAGVFGSGIIVARWLGPEGFGTYAVLNVTVALALQIGSAGLPSANTYFIARERTRAGP